jgi:hypothetical protein
MDQVLELAARLRDILARAGEADAALRLNDVLTTYWTTTSEALVELLSALDDTREAWERRLPAQGAALGDQVVGLSRELLNFE